MKSLKEELRKDNEFSKHFIKLHQPKYSKVPDIDYSVFKEGINRYAVSWLVAYITEMPLLEDNFEDNLQRDNWRDELCNKYGEENILPFLHNNKLRPNKSDKLLGYLEVIERDSSIQSNKQSISLITELENHISTTGRKYYELLKVPDQIEYMRHVEDKVYNILELIPIKQSSPP
jgi:hypothetical protein